MNTLAKPKPLLVVILDGWGVRLNTEGNAIAAAATPVMDDFAKHYPMAVVQASGLEVGLPHGVAGNSETGHRNIGAGRVEYQMMAHIDRTIEDGTFFDSEALNAAIDHAKQNKSNLHLMGLVSTGGVHSHINHLITLLKMLNNRKFEDRVYIHMFTDGRDTPPKSAGGFLQQVESAIGKYGLGKIASVTGRFYAMDRNRNWDRTKATFDMLTGGIRPPGASTPSEALQNAYNQGLDDEAILPTAITRGGGPVADVRANDAIIFFNFRPDRARQLTQAFTNPEQVGWEAKPPGNLFVTTMSTYDPDLSAHPAYAEMKAPNPLAKLISDAALTQLHVAETEKYAHITYYLSVGHEEPFAGEDRVLIKSLSVRNFAEEPAMGAAAITDRVLLEIQRGDYDVYFINFANADMVAHTIDFAATKKACSFVDQSLGRISDVMLAKGGAMVVTSDHGNAEQMIDPETGAASKDHSGNPVPFHYIRGDLKRSVGRSKNEIDEILAAPVGVLADVAPTVLDILRLEIPNTMTGVSLLGSLR